MACDVYFGKAPPTTPRRPDILWANPSIQVQPLGGGTPIVADSNGMVSVLPGVHQVAVSLYNAGNTDATNTTVDLWWSNPNTGFADIAQATYVPVAGQPTPTGTVYQATALPQPFVTQWTVDTTLTTATVPTGHVCLYARASRPGGDVNCVVSYNRLDPLHDEQSAIQNVLISATMGQSHHWGQRPPWWSFGFIAGHPGPVEGENVLAARALDPRVEADRARLWHLLSLQHVRSALGRCAKFGPPAQIGLGIGRESVFVPRPLGIVTPSRPLCGIGNIGPLSHDLSEHLLAGHVHREKGDKSAEYRMKLDAGQVHHALVQVKPEGDDGQVHAIDVTHHVISPSGPQLVGGLTVLFAAQCAP